MATLQFSCTLSPLRIIENRLLPYHYLHLNVTRHHCQSVRIITPSHQHLDTVSATTAQQECLTIPIPQDCLSCPFSAVNFVNHVCLSSHLGLSYQDLHSIAASLLSVRPEEDTRVAVVASVDILNIERIVTQQQSFVSVDETVVLDGYSSSSASDPPSASVVRKSLLKEPVKFEKREDEDMIPVCSICLDEFEEGCMVVSTPCSHMFHDGCINEWMWRKINEATCPFCRTELFG